MVVRTGRDRVAVADTDEPALLLEKACELRVVDPDRLCAEPRLQFGRVGRSFTEAAAGARPVEPGAPPFEPYQRDDRRSRAQTPANRKDAVRAQREARRTDLARQREAMASGDERYLPVRDKGPVRRFARDYIDSRWCVAEFFLPMAVVILVLTMIRVRGVQDLALSRRQ